MEPTAASEDLVAQWKDYQVVHLWGQKIYHYMKVELKVSIDPVSFNMFSWFPQLSRVLQAFGICCNLWSPFSPSLFSIRFLLDLSWNDMRRAFARPLEENHARMLFAAAYAVEPCPILCLDLGRGCLRLLKRINTGELPPQMSVNGQYWLGV
jgi:hypothetical protein